MADSTDARVQEVERSVESLESQVRAQIARTKAGARAVLIIGIILIIAIFGYMTWLRNFAQNVLEPSGLLDIMETEIRDNIPGFVGKLETALETQADANVAALREMVMAQVPAATEGVKGLAEDAINNLVDNLENKVGDVVGEVLTMKKMELDPLIQAASDPERQEELQAALQEGMEAVVAQKLDEVQVKFDRTMHVLNAELDKYSQPNEKLTPEQMGIKELIVSLLYFIDTSVRTGSIAEAAESAMSTEL